MSIPPDSPIKEDALIQEGFSRNPYPFWLWLVLLAVIASLFWGSRAWFLERTKEKIAASPFLQVTNRNFSLFLWQNPEYMRAHMRRKIGYLPAFQYGDKVTVEPELADQYIVAPPEIIFLYHTWNRLLGEDWSPCPILANQFSEFLKDAEEWQPRYWLAAPKEYKDLVDSLSNFPPDQDLTQLSSAKLPQIVRHAYEGWKNYFHDGDAVNEVRPTYEEMRVFLKKHPEYERHYWRNVLIDTYPDYLLSLEKHPAPAALIPIQELAPFLRVAFFNDKLCRKNT